MVNGHHKSQLLHRKHFGTHVKLAGLSEQHTLALLVGVEIALIFWGRQFLPRSVTPRLYSRLAPKKIELQK